MGFDSEDNISIDPRYLGDDDIKPLIGELLWHSINSDPRIIDISRTHYGCITADIQRYLPGRNMSQLKMLEIGAYAHISGYMIAREQGAEVTLFDISAHSLRHGHCAASANELDSAKVRRVAGDFHQLPFEEGEFDLVYLCSTLHHTARWQQVLKEISRVTAGGGIVILENEPILREFCFYLFRHNRVEELSASQKIFQKLDLLRTIGEPYGGSRPEMLFGMTENHRIPLEGLLGELARSFRIEELTPSVEVCMGGFEKQAEAEFCKGPSAAREFVIQYLNEQLPLITKELGQNPEGPATPLPDREAIVAMAEKISAIISRSGYGNITPQMAATQLVGPDPNSIRRSNLEHLLRRKPELIRDLTLSRIFGAGVRIVMRRELTDQKAALDRRPLKCLEQYAGVYQGFSEFSNEILNPSRTLVPALQTAEPNEIRDFFCPDWSLDSATGVRTLRPQCARPRILVPAEPGKTYLVAIRIHVSYSGAYWTLNLSVDGDRRACFQVRQSEGTCLTATVQSVSDQLAIELIPTLADGQVPPGYTGFIIAGMVVARLPAC